MQVCTSGETGMFIKKPTLYIRRKTLLFPFKACFEERKGKEPFSDEKHASDSKVHDCHAPFDSPGQSDWKRSEYDARKSDPSLAGS
jgi:hypothetical protein